jgi:hypothetical protein
VDVENLASWAHTVSRINVAALVLVIVISPRLVVVLPEFLWHFITANAF